MRRISEAAKRAAERRQREDQARRLQEVVPDLESLSIEVEETGAGGTEVSHIRHIVVAHAPALFELPCCDRHCNGGHDITQRLLPALRSRKTRIEGSDRCSGESKEGKCSLELRFVAQATYGA